MAAVTAKQCDLESVLLVPAANPPHRKHGAQASYDDRFRMVEIACARDPLLIPSRLDSGPGKSYSVLMVQRYLQENPEADPFFIMGADAFADITTWHKWRELAKLVTFAVVGRPGAAYVAPPETRVHPVDGVNLPISSSEIRVGIAGDHAAESDLPVGVLEYVRQHHLYKSFAG